MQIRIKPAATLALSISCLAVTSDASALSLPGIQDACWDIHVGNNDIQPIPVDFFGPGSEPFFTPPNLGIGLTPLDPTLPPFCDPGQQHPPIDLFLPDPVMPDPSVVQIEMIQLDLQSVQPIQVDFNDGSQQFFDVFVTIDGLPPQPSNLPIPQGQFTVDSFFDIAYQIEFVGVDSGLPAPGGPIIGDLPMISTPLPWFHDPVADLLVPGFDGVDLEPVEFISPTGGMQLTGIFDLPFPIPGDLDGDGFVGIFDLNIVLSNWNQSVPPADPAADPSGDGFVGIDDLNEVLGNWNASAPPSASAVPEPSTIAVLGLMGFAMIKRGR